MNIKGYQCITNPKTTIYDTPQQVYMVIQGMCTSKCSRSHRQYSKGHERQSHRHRFNSYKSKQNQSKENKYRRNKIRDPTRERKHNIIPQNKTLSEYNIHPNSIPNNKTHNTDQYEKDLHHYSFRPVFNGQDQSNCNYNRRLETQNVQLRKQNKCLQDYIQILERKCLKTDENRDKIYEYISEDTGNTVNIKNNSNLQSQNNSQYWGKGKEGLIMKSYQNTQAKYQNTDSVTGFRNSYNDNMLSTKWTRD